MKQFIVINGKTAYIIERESHSEATTFAQNFADHSKSTSVFEVGDIQCFTGKPPRKHHYQYLNLKKGERAVCDAGFPNVRMVSVRCIEDFTHVDEVRMNPHQYIKVIDGELMETHLISPNWYRIPN